MYQRLQKYKVALPSGYISFQDLQFLIRFSVSSVNTLEDAKVAKGCLYIQMPIQEVSDELGMQVLY